MKAYYLLAPIAAIALAGCAINKPVAYQPAVVTSPAVAVAPTYVAPSTTVVWTAVHEMPLPQGEGMSTH